MDRRRALIAALEGHSPADAVEDGYRTAMLALLGEAGDPFSPERFAPGHFTASAFVLAPGSGDLLMIHHRRLDRWLQPGGHVEPGDPDLEAAARREVLEETGLTGLEPLGAPALPFDLDIHEIPARGATPLHLHLDVRFLFRARNRRLFPATEVKAAAWMRRAEAARRNREAAMTRVLTKLPIPVPVHRGES